ncbi:MAG: hypothetical protein K8R99_03440 [Actinomycetia bacterium]|nr:hypothetical protein [Actinomycetes bacterium]
MKVRRVFLVPLFLGAALVSCSDSRISGGNSTTSAVTTTSAAAPTTSTQPPDTTSTSTTVAESTTSTSSTIPVVAGLDLSADGLGEESFGAEATGVIGYVQSILGSPTHDTGWIGTGGIVCSGTEYRYVTWGDLSLFLTDDSPYATGLRHFAGYTYGPAGGAFIDPFGLSIDGGVAVGDTVDELLAIYPSALVTTDEELGGALFRIVDALSGSLTGTGGGDTITSFAGGFACGG